MDLSEELLAILSKQDQQNSVEVFNELADIVFYREALDSEYFLNDSIFDNCGLYGKFVLDWEINNGEYYFTPSILKLMLKCAKENNLSNDDRYCNFLTYILRHVFVHYQNWAYNESRTKNLIGLLCLKIFSKTIENMRSPNDSDQKLRFSNSSKLCCAYLLYEESKNSLLRLLSEGNEGLTFLHEKLIKNAEDFSYISESINLSISLLIQLMDTEIISYFQKTSSHLPPLFTSFFVKEYNDDRSFLITMASFLNCRISTRISQKAVVFLQRVAELFPSSLLFGFGDQVSEFCGSFLNLFKTPIDENPDFRANCTKFLTICLEFQKALAEKLLELSLAEVQKKNNTENSVDFLRSILKSFRKENVNTQLFIENVRFLAGIWRFNYSEVVKFYKTRDFWPFLTAPLTFEDENFFLTVSCEIFNLLTWEIFRFGILGKDTNEISVVARKILDVERLELIFKKLDEFLADGRVKIREKLTVVKQIDDFLAVVLNRSSSSFNESNAFLVVEKSLQLQLKLMNSLTLDSDEECSMVVSMGYLYNLFGHFYSKTCEESNNRLNLKVVKILSQIIERLSDLDREDEIFSQILLEPAACFLILFSNSKNFEDERQFESISEAVCVLLTKLVVRFTEKSSKGDEFLASFNNVIALYVSCLSVIIRNLPAYLWSHSLKRYSILSNLLQLLHAEKSFTSKIFVVTCSLFSDLAIHEEAIKAIKTSGFCDFICASLPLIYSAAIPDFETVFQPLVAFYSSVLLHQGYKFVDETLKFLIAWEEYFFQFLNLSFCDPSEWRFNGLFAICVLLLRFSREKEMWMWKSARLINIITDLTSAIIVQLTSLITRPTHLLDSAVLKKKKKVAEEKLPLSPIITHRAIEVLLVCIQTLTNFAPSLQAILLYDSFDYDAYKCFCSPDFSTNISSKVSDYQLTFGHLLSLIQFCVSALRKTDPKLSSPSTHRSAVINPLSFQNVDRGILFTLLESSVYLCLTQGTLLFQQLETAESQRTVIKRELATELGLLLSKCGRPSGSPSSFRKSPSVCPSPAVTGFFGFNQEFLNNMREIVNSMIKS